MQLEFNQTTIVLCDKRWLNLWKSSLLPASLVMAAMIVAMIFSLTVIFPSGLWEKLPSLLAKELSSADWPRAVLKHFDLLIMLGFLTGQFFYLHKAQQLERVSLSPSGISYTSPLPGALKKFKPDWSLSWNEIRKIELGSLNVNMNSPEFVQLTLLTATGKQQIFPVRWVNANNYSRPAFHFRFGLSTPTRDDTLASAMSSEVMRYISGNFPGIPVEQNADSVQPRTSLEKDAHGKKALGIVALLIAYAIVDFIVGPDAYIDEPSSLLHIFIPAGIGGAVLSGIWLYRSALPAGEKTGLAFLIGVLVAVAMIPGALRINALTAPHGGARYEYRVMPGMDSIVLRPVVEGIPSINYFSKNRFWGKFGANDTYPVLVRKGILGFYQFDVSVIVDDIRKGEAGR
jgi:hypothetical protein